MARKRFIVDQFLEGKIFCGECSGILHDQSDIEVDHIIPHRGDEKLFWDRSNWQLLHSACHSSKTARGA